MQKIIHLIHYFRLYRQIISEKNSFKISILKKLKANLKGFTTDQYTRYNFDENDPSDYISEFERWKAREINGHYNVILDDKIVFHDYFKRFVSVPENFYWVSGGQIFDFTGSLPTDAEVISLMKNQTKTVLKPVSGGGSGKGIAIVVYNKSTNRFDLNGEQELCSEELLLDIKDRNNFIISEFVEQHDFSSNLYEKSVNTIRIVTAMNSSQPEILDAVMRIGNKNSQPVDNASKGAYISKINLETGSLSSAKTFFDLDETAVHPDSKAIIKNAQIPNWQQIKEEIINVHQHVPYIKLIAWDIVITERGFSVIEGNASSGLNIFQIWGGVRNEKIGEFFKKENII